MVAASCCSTVANCERSAARRATNALSSEPFNEEDAAEREDIASKATDIAFGLDEWCFS